MTLRSVFRQLEEHRVRLEGMLLKTNMVLPGKNAPKQASSGEVAHATVRCLVRSVPAAVPGVVFLSGGQSPEAATQHLNAINALRPHPWQLSFSYARALQEPALEAWRGQAPNVSEAQRIFYHRAHLNSAARCGEYSSEMEKEAD